MISRHLVAEIRAPFSVLDDAPNLVTALIDASSRAGATVLNYMHHRFDPQGVTAMVMLAESHTTIHTFPELGKAQFDAFTCGEAASPQRLFEIFCEIIGIDPKSQNWSQLQRDV